jgi:hypothetical protein
VAGKGTADTRAQRRVKLFVGDNTNKGEKGSFTEGAEKRPYHFLMNNKYTADGCCCL